MARPVQEARANQEASMRALVAVDLHHQPELVVDTAIAWADRLDAKLDLLHATGQSLGSWAYNTATEGRAPALDEDRMMYQLLARVPREQQGEVHLVSGRPIDVIPARGADYDLVMVGTHGRDEVRHLVVGSVAERVVRACPRPVLVLRGRPPEGRFPVLCAVDVRDPVTPMLVAETVMTWIHALGTADLAYVTSTSSTDAQIATDAELLGRLEAAIPANLRGQSWMETGDPAETLMAASVTHALTILVTHGRTGVNRWWLGSVAEQLVRVAPQSVLVLRRPT